MTTLRSQVDPVDPGSSRDGFALPAAIFAIAVVAILITGGFHMANQEHRVGLSSERSTQVFYLAEDGMGEALSNHRNLPSGFWSGGKWNYGTSITVSGARGEAVVRAQQVNDDGLYYVMSTGQIQEGPSTAQNSVGVMLRRGTAEINVDAALTTQGDVRLRGSAEIHGTDALPSAWGTLDGCGAGPAKPGVVVGEEGSVDVGGDAELTGDPPWEEDETIGDHTFQDFGGTTWDQLINAADHTFPGGVSITDIEASLDGDGNCNYADQFNWGFPYYKDDPDHQFAPCHDHFPIIYVEGNLSLQSNGYGQGVLLVEGNADLRGSFNFYGIVIVQGLLETQGGGGTGSPRIYGGAMARNADLERQSYVGGSVIHYSSCVIQQTLEHASGLTWIEPLAHRSWVDATGAGG